MKIYSDNENNDKEKIKYFAEKAKEVITLNNLSSYYFILNYFMNLKY